MPAIYSTRPNPALSHRRPGKSRQKACSQCVAAKTKCDRERPTCSRCRARGTDCDWGPAAHRSESPALRDSTPRHDVGPSVGTISLRWLAAMTHESDEPPRSKVLSKTTIYFCCRFLRAYPLQLATCPPFIHPTLLRLRPLANATTLVNMVQARAPGSEALVSQTVQNEMTSIMSTVS